MPSPEVICIFKEECDILIMKRGMRMNKYMPRLLDEVLKRRMQIYGAILIIGPKWCGKSTTAKQYAKSVLELQDPRSRENNLEIASSRPDLLLDGEKPRLIDEWQDAPMIWDAIRYDVDNTGLRNQYILTGSITPRDNKSLHTGTGRIVRLHMRTMSLFESGDSDGSVSLADLFNNVEEIKGISNKALEDVAYLCARGGWPSAIGLPKEDSLILARDYVDSLIMNDVETVDGVKRNPNRLRTVLRSLSRNICTTVSLTTIKDDTFYNDAEVSEKTISEYLTALSKLYVIDNVEAWCPKLRSKIDIRTTPKRCFVDPSIAVASLRASDKDLLKDFKTFGFIFEALCLRDLKIYAQSLDGDVFFYRDKSDLECDAVIHLRDGRWGAIEIKLGSTDSIDEAAKNLLRFSKIVDTDEMHKPSFLMVLTATKYAYKRDDGVYVVPVCCLKN